MRSIGQKALLGCPYLKAHRFVGSNQENEQMNLRGDFDIVI